MGGLPELFDHPLHDMINLPAPRFLPTGDQDWGRWWLDMLSAVEEILSGLETRTIYFNSANATVSASSTATICEVADVPSLINDTNLVEYYATATTGTRIPAVLLYKNGDLIDITEMGAMTKYVDLDGGGSNTYTVKVQNSGGVSIDCGGAINVIQF